MPAPPDAAAGRPPGAAHPRVLLPELAQLPGHLLWRAAARVTATLDDLTPAGVDLHAYAVLLALDGGLVRSQQELADTVGVSRTTMTRVAGALAEQRLVERTRNRDDRRSWALSRTPAGGEAAEVWHAHAEAVRDTLASGFTRAEHDQLVELLLRLAGDQVARDAPEPLRRSVAVLVTRVHAATHRWFVEAFAPLGLQPRMFGSLVALQATGPTSQAELARLLGTSAAHVVSIADDLEAAGLVERRRDPDDRRTHLLHLDARAPRVLERARRIAAEESAWLDLPARDVERLIRLLQRFVTAP